MSTRTLSRFREQTGTTPLQWLHRARVRRAQYLLETTDRSIEQIGEEAGFGAATTFREVFQRTLATSQQAYRRGFTAGFRRLRRCKAPARPTQFPRVLPRVATLRQVSAATRRPP